MGGIGKLIKSNRFVEEDYITFANLQFKGKIITGVQNTTHLFKMGSRSVSGHVLDYNLR
jgi:hypothetical protein